MKTQDNQITFETGAKTAGANNLILAVINDGKVYQERIHAANRLLQGLEPVRSFREITQAEANNQRIYGSKFKAAEITEAGKFIQQESLEHAIELMQDNQDKTKAIIADCRRWFDKINGNSYFSVSLAIPVKDSEGYSIINIPFQYGYGSQWQYQTLSTLAKLGFIPKPEVYQNGNKNWGYLSDYERNSVIIWHDQGMMQKRNMFNGLYL